MSTSVVEVSGDECDQCPHDAHVAAFVYAEFKIGSISLCGHCATAGWEKLNEQAVTVIDLRHLIPGWQPCESSPASSSP